MLLARIKLTLENQENGELGRVLQSGGRKKWYAGGRAGCMT